MFFNTTKAIKIISGSFLSLDTEDNRLRHVRTVLLVARCSKLAVSNIVDFVLAENDCKF